MVTKKPTSKGAGTSSSALPLYAVAATIVLILLAYGSLWAGTHSAAPGTTCPATRSKHCFPSQAAQCRGRRPRRGCSSSSWSSHQGLAGVGAAALQSRTSKTEVDAKARLMGVGIEAVRSDRESAATRAKTLRSGLAGLDKLDDADIGVIVGRTVQGDQKVFMSWEDMLFALAGPRMGKTAALAIDALCTAPGAALFTSNKRDGHDFTRGVREDVGTVWRYDLQGIAEGPLTGDDGFWWNPLRGVASIVAARKLASYFAAASRDDSARVDAYFDGGAQELLAQMVFAASCEGGDLLHVYGWLDNEENELPPATP